MCLLQYWWSLPNIGADNSARFYQFALRFMAASEGGGAPEDHH